MKEIILTQNKIALVDDEDYEWLNQYNEIEAALAYDAAAKIHHGEFAPQFFLDPALNNQKKT